MRRIRLSSYYNIDASLFFFNLMKVEKEVIQRNYIKDVYSKLDTRKYDIFADRITDQWNSLPDACVNSTTLNQFKPHISGTGSQNSVTLF